MAPLKQHVPAFHPADWSQLASRLTPTLRAMEAQISEIVSQNRFDASSLAVELTSHSDTLWSCFHTARTVDHERPGAEKVGSSTQFRVASISKVFTVLGILQRCAAGDLALSDPVTDHIPELATSDHAAIPWQTVTIRDLAGQLSGIPRDFQQCDVLNLVKDPAQFGLPPASTDGLPECGEYGGWTRACNAGVLFDQLKHKKLVHAPRTRGNYSNVNYDLLGVVLERTTGLTYAEYMAQGIFKPLRLDHTTLDTPSEENAVLPKLPKGGLFAPEGKNHWGADLGSSNPSGGIYSCSGDLSKFLRFVLTQYNDITPGVNWLLPTTWQQGMTTSYGMPWEIFRTDRYFSEYKRPVTWVSKSGGLPGYYSNIAVLEEYGIGLTILVGGNVVLVEEMRHIVDNCLIPGIETVIWQSTNERYSGTYSSRDSASTSRLCIAVSPGKGVHITSFISNGVDVLDTALFQPDKSGNESSYAQLTPTLLYKDTESQRGEIWRWVRQSSKAEQDTILDDLSVSDIDVLQYAGRPLNEVVIWRDTKEVELPAWELRLHKI